MKILTSNIIFAGSGQLDNLAKTEFGYSEKKITRIFFFILEKAKPNAELVAGVTCLEKVKLTRLTFQI